MKQHNLADAFGADIIGSVHIPVHLNIFPVGLDGSGHLGLAFPNGLMDQWAESLEQTVPHLIADNWEHKYGKTDKSKDFAAAIDYSVSVQVIPSAPSVSAAFARMLHAQHRVVEGEHGEAAQASDPEDDGVDAYGHRSKVLSPHAQVDGDMVTDMISDLAATVNAPRGYSIGLLNPKRDWIIRSMKTHDLFDVAMEQSALRDTSVHHHEGKIDGYGASAYPPFYGYRSGLATHELQHVMHDDDTAAWRERLTDVFAREAGLMETRMEREVAEIGEELKLRRQGKAHEKGYLPIWEPVPLRYRLNERALAMLDGADVDREIIGVNGAEARRLHKEEMAEVKQEEEEERRMEQQASGAKAAKAAIPASISYAKRAHDRIYKKRNLSLVSSRVATRATLQGAVKPAFDHSAVDTLSDQWAREIIDLFPYDHASPGKSVHGVARFLKKTSPYTLYQATGSSFMQETCLVDAWIGSERAAVLDFAAGPFKWGPIVGGEDVRTYYSYPNIDALAKLHVATDPEVYARGGMLYYDYVKGENRRALDDADVVKKHLDHAAEGDVVTSGTVSAGGNPVHIKAAAQPRARVAVEARRAEVANPEAPVVGQGREDFVDVDNFGVEDAAEWGVAKKKKNAAPPASKPALNKARRVARPPPAKRRRSRIGSRAMGAGRRPLLEEEEEAVDGRASLSPQQPDGPLASLPLPPLAHDPLAGFKAKAAALQTAQTAFRQVPAAAPLQQTSDPALAQKLRGFAQAFVDHDVEINIPQFMTKVLDFQKAQRRRVLRQQQQREAQLQQGLVDADAEATPSSHKPHMLPGKTAGRFPSALHQENMRRLLTEEEEDDDDMDNYDNYFSKEELELMKSVMKPSKTGDKPLVDPRFAQQPPADDDAADSASNTDSAAAAAQQELSAEQLARSLLRSDEEDSRESLEGMDALFKDDLLAQAMQFVQENEKAKTQGANARKGSDLSRSAEELLQQHVAQQQRDYDAELARHRGGNDEEPVGSADTGAATDAATGEAETEDDDAGEAGADAGGDGDEADIDKLMSQYESGEYDHDVDDLLVDDDEIMRELMQGAHDDAEPDTNTHANTNTNTHAETPAETSTSAPTPASTPVPDAASLAQYSQHTPEQVAAEAAMLEQLLHSDVCTLGAMDCAGYRTELAELKAVMEKHKASAGGASATPAEGSEAKDEDEEDDDEEDAEEDADGVKLNVKLGLSDENNVDESGASAAAAADLLLHREKRDLWSDDEDEDDEAHEEALKKFEADAQATQRRIKQEREDRRRKLLEALPRGAAGSAGHSESMGEMNVMEHFLAHTTHNIRRHLRDAVLPPVADMHTPKLYHRKVAFNLYVVRNHNSYDPLEGDLWPKLQLALEQLRVRGQQFSFQLHELHLSSDPALAMAYTSSLRAAVVPTMLFDGSLSSVKRLYLDSKTLEAELSARLLTRSNPLPRNTREVPIFLFSLQSDLPVFVDKYFQARALPGMVMAVQSSYHLWESPLTCNGRPVYWNLNNPLKPMLQSAMLSLAGALPAHQSVDPVAHGPTQAWQWSVGDSPLSALCSGEDALSVPKHAIDALHRNYIIHALRVATDVVNRATARLMRLPTSAANMAVLELTYTKHTRDARGRHVVGWEGQKLYKLIRKAHRSVRYRIHKMRKLASRLDYAVAVRHIRDLIGTGYQYHALVELVRKYAKNQDCLADKQHAAPALVQMAEKDGSVQQEDGEANEPKLAPRTKIRFSKSSRRVVEQQQRVDGLSAYVWICGIVLILVMAVYRCLKSASKSKAY